MSFYSAQGFLADWQTYFEFPSRNNSNKDVLTAQQGQACGMDVWLCEVWLCEESYLRKRRS